MDAHLARRLFDGQGFKSRLVPAIALMLALGPLTGAQDHLSRSIQFLQEDNLAAAEKEAQAALADPGKRAGANAALGAIRLREHKYPESEEFLRSAIRFDARLVGAHINLGTVLNLQGKFGPAAEAFRGALALDPENRSARHGLAQAEAALGDYRASLEAAGPLLGDLRKSVRGLLLLATDYAGLRDEDSLNGVLADWRSLPAPDSSASIDLARLLSRNGFIPRSIEVLEAAKKAGPLSFDLSYELAACYMTAGDTRHASANYVIALSLDSGCIECYRQIAAIADKEGDLDQAVSYLLMASRKAPENPDVLGEFGWACMKKDLIDDAAAAFDKALQIRPGHEPTIYRRASAHVGKKEYEQAIQLLAELVAKHPDDPGLNYALGSVLYLAVKLDDAEKYVRKSVELAPNAPDSQLYLGLILEGQNRQSEAIQVLEKSTRRFPDHAPSFEALGTLLFKAGKFPEARRVLEKSIELKADSIKAHYQLGMLLARTGRKAESQAHLRVYKELQAKEQSQPQQVLLQTPP